MEKVKKSEIVDIVAQNCGIPKKTTSAVINNMIRVILCNLANEKDVYLAGLGTFYVDEKSTSKRVIKDVALESNKYFKHITASSLVTF